MSVHSAPYPEGGQPNAIITFRDEQGHEWIAAAIIGPVMRSGDDSELLGPEKLRDRAFGVTRLTIVTQ